MTSADLAALGALADEHRRDLLASLATVGPQHAGALAEQLGISRQGTIKHLDLLADAGLIESHRAGRRVVFQVRVEPLRATSDWLLHLADSWDRQLLGLKRAAEAAESAESADRRT